MEKSLIVIILTGYENPLLVVRGRCSRRRASPNREGSTENLERPVSLRMSSTKMLTLEQKLRTIKRKPKVSNFRAAAIRCLIAVLDRQLDLSEMQIEKLTKSLGDWPNGIDYDWQYYFRNEQSLPLNNTPGITPNIIRTFIRASRPKATNHSAGTSTRHAAKIYVLQVQPLEVMIDTGDRIQMPRSIGTMISITWPQSLLLNCLAPRDWNVECRSCWSLRSD